MSDAIVTNPMLPIPPGTSETGKNWAYALQYARLARMASAPVTVQSRIDELQNFTIESRIAMDKAIKELKDLLASLVVPDVSDIAVASVDIDSIDYTKLPPMNELEIPGPDTIPGGGDTELQWNDIDTSDIMKDVAFPGFNVPDIVYTAPSLDPLDFPNRDQVIGNPPDLLPVTTPDRPDYDPVQPLGPVKDLIIPDHEFEMPDEFDHELLPWNIDQPGKFTWGEPTYNSDIWADLLGKILHNIQNGGTGLDPQVEEDIYWQHLNRTAVENERAYIEANNYWSSRGFTMPPGMLSSKINEINSQITRNNLQASKDITINQAELAQKNTHFFIEKGAQLEGMLREFFINQANLTLTAARTVAENAIVIYNAKAQEFQYYLEEYKTEAMVYGEKIKAALGKVDIYRAQIEAVKAEGDVEKLKVDIYTAQINANRTLAEMYKTEMEGAALEAQLNSLLLQEYREKVNVFTSLIDAEKAKVLAFQSQVEAEKAKADMYRAQVGAYSERVGAESKKLEANIAVVSAEIERNKAYLEKYKSEIQHWNARVDAWARSIGAQVEGYKAEVSGYIANVNADEAHLKAQVAEIEARVKEAEFKMRQAVALVDAAIVSYTKVKELQTTGYAGIMNVGAQLVGSAMNAINASANIGYSAQDSSAEGTYENHSFNYGTLE